MARALHSDEFKARAIALAVEHGPAEAQRILAGEGVDVKPATIRSWCSRAGVATVAAEKMSEARETLQQRRDTKREQVRTLLIEKCADMLERMDHEHYDYRGKDATRVTFDRAPSGACQQYATAAAILLDKFRLEMGEATGRTEQRVEPIRAAEEVLDELAERRKRNAA